MEYCPRKRHRNPAKHRFQGQTYIHIGKFIQKSHSTRTSKSRKTLHEFLFLKNAHRLLCKLRNKNAEKPRIAGQGCKPLPEGSFDSHVQSCIDGVIPPMTQPKTSLKVRMFKGNVRLHSYKGFGGEGSNVGVVQNLPWRLLKK